MSRYRTWRNVVPLVLDLVLLVLAIIAGFQGDYARGAYLLGWAILVDRSAA